MSQVPMTRTNYTPVQMAAYLVPEVTRQMKKIPVRTLAELMLAQLCLETTSGYNLWNNNYGNVDISDASQDYWMAQGQANHIRSFRDPMSGMAEYVRQVVIRRPSMVRAGQAGDALAFATAIRDTAYTPGIDVAKVAATLTQFVQQFRTQKLFDNLPTKVQGWFLPVVGGLLTLLFLAVRRRWG